MTLVEVCVDDVGGAAAAREGGADRVEVCAALSDGGTTPSAGLLACAARDAGPLDVQVLVRPRAGDFVCSPFEVEVMLAEIDAARSLLDDDPRLGFTLGALTADGALDEAALAALVAACGPHPVLFHKAFDTALDTALAAGHDTRRLLDALVGLGVAGVLTAGGPGPAVEQLEVLARLVEAADARGLRVVVGGGVRPGSARRIVEATGCREVHLRAPGTVPSESRVGSAYDPGSRTVTDPALVAAVVAELD